MAASIDNDENDYEGGYISLFCFEKHMPSRFISDYYLDEDMQRACTIESSLIPANYISDEEQDFDASGEKSTRTAELYEESVSGSYYASDDTMNSSFQSENTCGSYSSESLSSTETAEEEACDLSLGDDVLTAETGKVYLCETQCSEDDTNSIDEFHMNYYKEISVSMNSLWDGQDQNMD
ncbi:unnamed protein product [Auanema sp. JU1783]|nr:unnamed protein product [Auanema sp. JU1783]